MGQGRITTNYLTRLRFMECLIKGHLLFTEKGTSKEEKDLSCDVQQRARELTLELYCINIQFLPI